MKLDLIKTKSVILILFFFNKLSLIFRLIFYVDIDNKKLLIEYLYELSFETGRISIEIGKLNDYIDNKYNSETSAQDEGRVSQKLEKKKLIILMKIVLENISEKTNLFKEEYKYDESADIDIIIQKLNEFLKYVEDFMNTKGWHEDTVFQRELEIARLSIADMEAFLEIIEFYSKEPKDFLNILDFIEIITDGDSNNIKDDIENNIKSNMANFRRFFENLENIDNKNIRVSSEEKEKLDLIVDVYENYSKDIDCNKYRRILLEHTEKQYQ